jgi:hypothetical protein
MDLLWGWPLLLAIIERRGARERGSRLEVPGAHGRAGGSEVSRRRRRSNCATMMELRGSVRTARRWWNCATAFELRDDDGTARRRWNCATVHELRDSDGTARRCTNCAVVNVSFLKLGNPDQFFSFFFSLQILSLFGPKKWDLFFIFS